MLVSSYVIDTAEGIGGGDPSGIAARLETGPLRPRLLTATLRYVRGAAAAFGPSNGPIEWPSVALSRPDASRGGSTPASAAVNSSSTCTTAPWSGPSPTRA